MFIYVDCASECADHSRICLVFILLWHIQPAGNVHMFHESMPYYSFVDLAYH